MSCVWGASFAWRQKVWWMSAKKHVSRISAESRWQEGIFLVVLGGGVGASNQDGA